MERRHYHIIRSEKEVSTKLKEFMIPNSRLNINTKLNLQTAIDKRVHLLSYDNATY